MSGLHGAFSTGFLLAAGLGVLALRAGIDPGLHLGEPAFLAALTMGWAIPRLPHSIQPNGTTAAAGTVPGTVVARLMILVTCAAFVEGVCVDWAAVYLTGQQHATPAQGAAGYLAFAVSMTVARFGGDALTRRLGSGRLAGVSSRILLSGLWLAALHISVPATLLALMLCGAGCAVLAPLTFSAAGRTAHPAAMSWVTNAFVPGFLIAPGVTGAVTQVGSVALAFVPGMGMALVALFLSKTLAPDGPAAGVRPVQRA